MQASGMRHRLVNGGSLWRSRLGYVVPNERSFGGERLPSWAIRLLCMMCDSKSNNSCEAHLKYRGFVFDTYFLGLWLMSPRSHKLRKQVWGRRDCIHCADDPYLGPSDWWHNNESRSYVCYAIHHLSTVMSLSTPTSRGHCRRWRFQLRG